MYQFTENPDIIRCVETGAIIPRGHYLWPTEWLENNTPLSVEPMRSLEEWKDALKADATSARWNHETGGISIGGVQVGTTLDDQNRLSGVLSAIQLGGLESVDFKAQSGWTQLTEEQLQGIALAISAHVQACFTAERAHHEAIDMLDTVPACEAYDVTQGWP